MTLLIIFALLLSGYCAYKTYMADRGKKFSAFYKYSKLIVHFLFMTWFLLLPFQFRNFNMILSLTPTIIVISIFLILVIKKKYDHDTGFLIHIRNYFVLPVILINTYIYLPLFLVDYLRYYTMFHIILYTIVAVLIVSIFLFLPQIIKSKRIVHLPLYSYMFLMIISMVAFFLNASQNITTVDGELRTFNYFDDYYSVNEVSVDDGTLNGEIYHYYYDDTNVYYIVDVDNIYTFKVYNYKSESFVFSLDIDVTGDAYFYDRKYINPIVEIEDTIYCFLLDGIYVYDNGSLIKQNNFNINDTKQFTYNDAFYFEYYNETLDTKQVYKVTDTIEATNEFDSIGEYVIHQNRILVLTDSTMRFLDSSDPRAFDGTSYFHALMTDTHYIDTDYDSSNMNYSLFGFNFGEYQHELTDLDGNSEVYPNPIHVDRQNLKEFNGLYYTSRNQIKGPYYSNTFVDESFNRVGTYSLYMFNKDYEGSNTPSIKEINNQLTYITTNHVYFDEKPNLLYFEINSLHEQKSILAFDYHSILSVYTYLIGFTIFSFLLFLLEAVKRSNTSKDIAIKKHRNTASFIVINDDLLIRKPQESDIKDRFTLGRSLEFRHMLGASNIDLKPYKYSDAEMLYMREKFNKYSWFIIYKGKMIGVCRLKVQGLFLAKYTIGIYDESLLSKGIGTKVTTAITDYAFNTLGLKELELTVVEYNSRAIACFEKCGFTVSSISKNSLTLDGEVYNLILMKQINTNTIKESKTNEKHL